MTEQTKEQTPQFTVFADCDGETGFFHSDSMDNCDSLQAFVAWVVAWRDRKGRGWTPVAWSHGYLIERDRAEAIAAGRTIAPFYCTAETLKPAEPWVREKLRQRLTWADSKPFDAFHGFATDKWSIENDLYTDSSHPTQRIASASAQVSPAFGSAFLVR